MRLKALARCGLTICVACLASACVFGERTAEQKTIHSTVRFVSQSGVPLAGEKVLIVETIGWDHMITEVVLTDHAGAVTLDGVYCAPVMVATDGADVALGGGAIRSEYTVSVPDSRRPTKERMYGEPDADYRDTRKSARYESCGL